MSIYIIQILHILIGAIVFLLVVIVLILRRCSSHSVEEQLPRSYGYW